jgi:hypothetical protein
VFASYGFKAGKFPTTIAANGQENGHEPTGERAGIRTLDPVIKSHVLYQLSYALHLADQILKLGWIYQSRAPFYADFALCA